MLLFLDLAIFSSGFVKIKANRARNNVSLDLFGCLISCRIRLWIMLRKTQKITLQKNARGRVLQAGKTRAQPQGRSLASFAMH
jgi:hypothetical protein